MLSGCGGATPWQPLDPPVPAPEFSLPGLTGQTVRLSDYRGRIVVMEFWATWCGVCRQTMPSLELLYRRYRDRGVEVLLVDMGEEPKRVKRWAGSRFESTIVLDERNRAARAYGVSGIPALFVIDAMGLIRYTKTGYGGGLERDLTGILDGLLAEPPASAAAEQAAQETP
jgi:peroxiredoxin